MQSLLRQVLCEPAATINVWKEKVQAALGRNGRLMTDVLPGLGHLIGPQPELPPVEATAAQNRLDILICYVDSGCRRCPGFSWWRCIGTKLTSKFSSHWLRWAGSGSKNAVPSKVYNLLLYLKLRAAPIWRSGAVFQVLASFSHLLFVDHYQGNR